MGIFSRTPREPVKPDPTRYDIKGQDIWDLIAEGIAARGYAMRRGTGNFGRDKWGDGDYHLTFNADPITPEPTGMGMFVDDVRYPKAAWNALTTAEKRKMCQEHVVSFKVVDDAGDIVNVSGVEPEDQAKAAG